MGVMRRLTKSFFCLRRLRKRIPRRSNCSRRKPKLMSTSRFQSSSMHNYRRRRNKLILNFMVIVFNAITRRSICPYITEYLPLLLHKGNVHEVRSNNYILLCYNSKGFNVSCTCQCLRPSSINMIKYAEWNRIKTRKTRQPSKENKATQEPLKSALQFVKSNKYVLHLKDTVTRRERQEILESTLNV
uniref:Uncharacterized protein n=2 Tax=Parascaris univalens TaxID=6257 RepID=A0A915A168_PARUN